MSPSPLQGLCCPSPKSYVVLQEIRCVVSTHESREAKAPIVGGDSGAGCMGGSTHTQQEAPGRAVSSREGPQEGWAWRGKGWGGAGSQLSLCGHVLALSLKESEFQI